ncbi:long-chain-fatty-acid--CoA ligase [Afipia sp. DC4300-2b1]|uniref:long-chain-fatty-acid--CoA ligase n=1 Tax=Afipia sp. DC4300-2b1 TaxID=2804672 RepID=UPI003CF0C916
MNFERFAAAGIRTVADIISYQAQRQSGQTALSFAGTGSTYKELNLLSNRVANGLAAMGIQPGSRIAVLDKTSDIFFQVCLGAAKARAALVPVNFRLARPELQFLLNDSEAEILFVGDEFAEVARQLRPSLPALKQIISMSDYARWRDANADTQAAANPQEDDVFLQIYTSGTTGNPKGAQLTHKNMLASLPRAVEAFGELKESDVLFIAPPLFHVAGCGTGILGFLAGARNVIVQDFVPAVILETMKREAVTVALFVPAMIQGLLGAIEPQVADLPALRTVVYGASPMPKALLVRAMRAFPAAGFVQIFGLTETTGVITALSADDHKSAALQNGASCGKPLDGVDLKIVNSKGQAMATRQTGEILCRSPQVMKGYWKLPTETANALRSGWFHTGDVGYLDDQGYLYICDRLKDLIVSGGENIYPAEIESVLLDHPLVADAAVIGVPDPHWGEATKAIIVVKQSDIYDSASVLDHCRQHLAGYKVPKSVDVLESLPRNSSGKIIKRELRKKYWENMDRQVN